MLAAWELEGSSMQEGSTHEVDAKDGVVVLHDAHQLLCKGLRVGSLFVDNPVAAAAWQIDLSDQARAGRGEREKEGRQAKRWSERGSTRATCVSGIQYSSEGGCGPSGKQAVKRALVSLVQSSSQQQFPSQESMVRSHPQELS